jgi:ABC-2 type transport system permease protein
MDILRALSLARLSRNLAEQGSFWAAFFVDISVFVTQAVTFWFIYFGVGSAGTEGAWRGVFFVGTFSAIDGMYMATYFFGLLRLPEIIRTGELDVLLTKPGSPLLRVAFASVNPGSVALVLPGFLMMALAASKLGLSFTPERVLSWCTAALLSLMLNFDLMTLIRLPAFFIKRGEALQEMEGALVTFGYQVPGWTCKGPERILFRFILPYGLIASFPAETFLGMAGAGAWLAVCAVVLAFSALTCVAWKMSLARYGSAGN